VRPMISAYQTVVRQGTEAPCKPDTAIILDCSVDLTACRRAAIVQMLVCVKAAKPEGCVVRLRKPSNELMRQNISTSDADFVSSRS
jgi:hypothetical protein